MIIWPKASRAALREGLAKLGWVEGRLIYIREQEQSHQAAQGALGQFAQGMAPDNKSLASESKQQSSIIHTLNGAEKEPELRTKKAPSGLMLRHDP
jgi:hypothetical protein